MPDTSGPRRDQFTLVFDGDCGFCTTSVRWLEHALPAPPPVSPFQWADLAALGLTAEEAASMVWLISSDDDGTVHQYGGYLAVSALLRHQPAVGWRFLGVLLDTLPFSLIADLGYRLVARYRHLLPGGTPACKVDREG
jgi:predicted DCC family thiol-disulfide oxidoreductase YuxK